MRQAGVLPRNRCQRCTVQEEGELKFSRKCGLTQVKVRVYSLLWESPRKRGFQKRDVPLPPKARQEGLQEAASTFLNVPGSSLPSFFFF